MRRIIIESPYAGEIAKNEAYLGAAIKDSLSRGESPYASHGFLPRFLDDNNPEERKTGIDAGLQWAKDADAVIYYLDRGLSGGMRYALKKHTQASRNIEVRLLCGETHLSFLYKNWKGEVADRRARFKGFYWGRTQYHPEDQVLMEAYCLDRKALRMFAVNDLTVKHSPPFKY